MLTCAIHIACSNQFSVADGEDSSVYGEIDSLSEGDISFDEEDGNERTSLLPAGLSTHEGGYPPRNKRNDSGRPPTGDERSKYERKMRDDRQREKPRQRDKDLSYDSRDGRRSRKGRHRDSRSSRRDQYDYDEEYGSSSPEYSGADGFPRGLSYEDRKQMERSIRKQMMKELEESRCCNRFGRWIAAGVKRNITDKVGTFLWEAEAFISNLPLTIGAVALAIVTLGIVWFKFAEEMLESCRPVHFHSSQCNFPEFPGCFYCDTSVRVYEVALGFHQGCSALAGFVTLLFVLKIFIARQVFVDEMNSPTTSSPAGLICMTIVCVFAGHGPLGQAMVTLAAAVHFVVAVWFIYMAAAYNILPDPSWFPNTVGIGISAVKIWLYYPVPGHFLMAVSRMLC